MWNIPILPRRRHGDPFHGASSVDRRSRTDPGSRAKEPPTLPALDLRACASRLVCLWPLGRRLWPRESQVELLSGGAFG
jgi:hypothetical protein